jgi:ribose transport system substrate-binding protein
MKIKNVIAVGLLLLPHFVFAETPAPKYKIAVIPKSDNGWWKKMKAGAQKAAHEENVQIFWVGTETEDQIDKQAEIIKALSTKVDGFVLAPMDRKKIVAPVEAVHALKKPIVLVDAPVDSKAPISMLATDNLLAGAEGARQMANALKGETKAKVAVIRFLENIQTTDDRAAGFIGEAQKIRRFEVINEKIYGGATVVTALRATQALLKKYPDVKGIFATNWPVFESTLRALKQAGKAGKLKMVGVDEPDICIQGLRTGEVSAVIMQNPFNMGYLGVKSIVRALNGEHVEAKQDTGTVVVLKSNIDSTAVQNALNPKIE